MAVPAVTRTWQYDVNDASSASTSLINAQGTLFRIKDALISFATNPWQVIASSDGSTADLTDNWTGSSQINWDDPGMDRSWILLRNGDGVEFFEVLIDCASGATPREDHLQIDVSFGGFDTSGITPSITPSATDKIVLKDGTSSSDGRWFNDLADSVIHVWHADTGLHTRVVGYTSGVANLFWIFEKVDDPVSGLADPYVVGASPGNSGNVIRHADWNDTAQLRGYHNGETFNVYMTSEGFVNAMIGQQINAVNDFGGGYPASEIGLASTDISHTGRIGEIVDLWWGVNSGLNQADTFPSGGGKTHVYMGQLIHPWNGSTPVTSG